MPPNSFMFILLSDKHHFLMYHFLSIALRDSKSVQPIILHNTLWKFTYSNLVPPPRIVQEDEYIYSFEIL